MFISSSMVKDLVMFMCNSQFNIRLVTTDDVGGVDRGETKGCRGTYLYLAFDVIFRSRKVDLRD